MSGEISGIKPQTRHGGQYLLDGEGRLVAHNYTKPAGTAEEIQPDSGIGPEDSNPEESRAEDVDEGQAFQPAEVDPPEED
ncbi:MAG: hypothetical protein AAGU11_22155 [Syntrophobacteraceae bacterium]